MNQGKAKQLRKVFLKKTSAVLLLIRDHYGEETQNMTSPQALWRRFKKMYKQGLVPDSLLILEKENK